MLPHDAWGGWMPSPRNESDASARMAKATLSEACTMIGLKAFGTTCRQAAPPAGAPQRPRGIHVVARRDREHLATHEPRERGRVDHPEREEHAGEAGAQHRTERQRQH